MKRLPNLSAHAVDQLADKRYAQLCAITSDPSASDENAEAATHDLVLESEFPPLWNPPWSANSPGDLPPPLIRRPTNKTEKLTKPTN